MVWRLLVPLALAATAAAAPAFAEPPDAEPAKKSAPPSDALAERLRAEGFELKPGGEIEGLSDSRVLRQKDLESAGLEFDESGRIVFAEDPERPLDDDQSARVVKNLFSRQRARNASPTEAGEAMRAWGIPQVADGWRLLNPNGDATYCGRYVYESMKDHPPKRVVATSFKPTIGLGMASISTDWKMYAELLGIRGTNESGHPSDSGAEPVLAQLLRMDKHKLNPVTGRFVYSTLSKLMRTQYDKFVEPIGGVPVPKAEEGVAPPSHAVLPGLLRRVSQMIGKPLSDQQKRSIIESFPMGEYLTQTGVYKLWDKGLDGRRIGIGIIDTGIPGNVPEFAGHVAGRIDVMENYPYDPERDYHGVSTGYTALASAPKATLRSYRAQNHAGHIEHLGKAIDRAVADGNQVINLSLGNFHYDPNVARKINEYSGRGVIFVASAGNEAGDSRYPPGLRFPSSVSSVLSAGALDVKDSMANFSSFGTGPTSEPEATKYKPLYLAPGGGVTKLISAGPQEPPRYISYYGGSSLAAPNIAGIIAQLVQQALAKGVPSSRMNAFIADALARTSKPLNPDRLPRNFPEQQRALVVDPAAASAYIDGRPGRRHAALRLPAAPRATNSLQHDVPFDLFSPDRKTPP